MSDKPIEPMDYVGGVTVVDFGEYKVKRGRTKREFTMCPHLDMTYDPIERRVWCQDCEHEIEPFDAFEALVNTHSKAWSKIKREWEKVQFAVNKKLHLIAARKIEKDWRSRRWVPTCPHCDEAIFPQDKFGSKPKEREIEARKFKSKKVSRD